MSRPIFYGWLFVLVILFVTVLFQLIRFGFTLRTMLGLSIGIGGLFFLKYYKSKVQ
jgi:hypothetical protein